MKYIVYQTINLINNKIYVGYHRTENPEIFDGYLGCGVKLSNPYFINNPRTPFQYALKKYGVTNFKRIVLASFNTVEEALNLEKEIVNIDFIKRKDTYNVALGGNAGQFLFPINQFDNTGKLIYKWDNMAIAAETLGVSHTSINNAKLYKGSCLGYFWSTEDTINPKEFSYHVGTKTYQYDIDGNLIGQYASITEAAKAVNDDDRAIHRAIKTGMKHRDYYWSFKLSEKYIPIKKVSLKGKTLYIYDLDGNFIKEVLVGQELKDFYKISHYGCLKQAIQNNRPYKNTQISFEKVDIMPKVIAFSDFNAKRIGRYSKEGKLLEEFNSIKAAVKKYGSGVNRVLLKRQETTKGYIFKYLD